jgi:hypothetical protein
MDQKTPISKIIIPTRVQCDTAAAIFILKKFGNEQFPEIQDATIEIWSQVPEGETEESLRAKGTLLIDIGGGIFDHHDEADKITATDLICNYLGLSENPALEKLRSFVQRSDFFGKGIISSDPLDRAFGLPGLIVNVNKQYNSEPNVVANIIIPLIDAHYFEEERRTIDIPKEFEEKMQSGDIELFSEKQHGKNLKCIFIASDNMSMAGFLRSQNGGRYDVVALQLSSGHINILTRPTKKVDLRHLVAVLRQSELMKKGDPTMLPYTLLSQTGRVEKVPEWYFDPATNSIQNGGINPGAIAKTRLQRDEVVQLIHIGLSGQS